MDQQKQFQVDAGKLSPWRAAWPYWCFLAFTVLSILPVFVETIPQRDVAFRYAPMAEAFRDGDFIYAFHPRTGFLHTFTSGIICYLLNCNGFLACKISSLLFMGLGLFPLYAVMRRVYSRFMAEICTFIFVLASQLHRLSWSGLRDSHKTFLLLLAAYSLILIFQEREKWTGYIWLGIAAGLGIVTRGDLVLIMSLLFFWGIVLELKLKKFPWRSVLGSILALMLALPAIVLNWYLAGVAVPEIRFAWIFRKVMHRYPGITDSLPLIAAGLLAAFLAAWGIRVLIDAGFGKILSGICAAGLLALLVRQFFNPEFYLEDSVLIYLGSIFKGFFPVFAVVGLIGIGFRLYRKQWTCEESILAAILFGHAVLVCTQIILNDCILYVSFRYLLPAVPLEFGWGVIGILSVWELLTRPFRMKYPQWIRRIGCIAFIFAVGFFLLDFYYPVIEDHYSERERRFQADITKIVELVKKDYRGPAQFRPAVNPGLYIPKLNPAILFLAYRPNRKATLPDYGRVIVAAYLVKGRVTDNLNEADYVIDKYSPLNQLPPGLRLLGEAKLGKEKYRIWKKIK